MAAPNAPKLSDRLWEPASADTEKEQAGAVRGAAPAGAQAVAGGATGAAPAAVELPQTLTPGWEALPARMRLPTPPEAQDAGRGGNTATIRCSALLGDGVIAWKIRHTPSQNPP
jgi:hypothetical protein